MIHIIVAAGVVLVPAILLGILLCQKKFKVERFSTLLVILIAVAGYIYQSGENRRIQDLQYKRETYAILMEGLAILKRSGDKTGEAKNLERAYYRSWAETSDEVNKKLLEYLEAYKVWSNNKIPDNEKVETEKFDELVKQIKKEIKPRSQETFKAYSFGLKEQP